MNINTILCNAFYMLTFMCPFICYDSTPFSERIAILQYTCTYICTFGVHYVMIFYSSNNLIVIMSMLPGQQHDKFSIMLH